MGTAVEADRPPEDVIKTDERIPLEGGGPALSLSKGLRRRVGVETKAVPAGAEASLGEDLGPTLTLA